jgi:hypothetical protein
MLESVLRSYGELCGAENYLLWCGWWVGLGILSSVGLGTGLHTFLLYLGQSPLRVFNSVLRIRITLCGSGSALSLNVDPDLSFHFDPDPTFHFYPDLYPPFHFDAEPDLTIHFDPDPAFHSDADPEPTSQNNTDLEPAFQYEAGPDPQHWF